MNGDDHGDDLRRAEGEDTAIPSTSQAPTQATDPQAHTTIEPTEPTAQPEREQAPATQETFPPEVPVSPTANPTDTPAVLAGLPASISSPLLYIHQRASKLSKLSSGVSKKNTRSRLIGGVIIVLLSITLLSPVAFAIAHGQIRIPSTDGSGQTQNPRLIDGPLAWSLDRLQTALPAADAGFAIHTYPLDPIFHSYYLRHAGALWLGAPITTAFIIRQGVIQFFEDGALLAPGQYSLLGRQSSTNPPGTPGAANDVTANDLSSLLIEDGVFDQTADIEWIPLLHGLLSVGSKAPLLLQGDSSATSATSATYVQLRAATAPAALVAERPGSLVASSVWIYAALGIGPSTPVTVSDNPTGTGDPTPAKAEQPVSKPVFVAEGNSNGTVVGHYIPPQIWNMLLRPDIAPDGWQVDLGAPLSEALPMTTTASDGIVHHLLVQAFWEGVITYDLDAASSDQALAPLALGRAYLLTLGAPTPYAQAGLHAWMTGDSLTPITTHPGGKAEVHLGLNAPVTLTGAATWYKAILCYSVRWATRSQHNNGWAPASALTVHAPAASASVWEEIDALSPQLASYLATLGDNVGVAVYDLSHNTYYVSNEQQVFIMASSAKAPLLVAYLAMLETEGAVPQESDIATLSAMIENSDNDAAQLVYQTIGYDAGLDVYLQSIGINDYVRNPNGWGYGEWSPLSMVRLLTMLQDGQLLNSDDTNLALSLMSNVVPDEQEGVGDTAPAGASYAMKDGWVQGPDGLWDVNSSGIVTLGSETYAISVYTEDQDSLESGWYITQQVCGPIGHLLT